MEMQYFPGLKHTTQSRGALITAGVLTAGLISFRQGNSHLGQKLMRARVVVQGATVALMVGTAYYYGENPWLSK
ncbi:RING-H2 finger protein ATL48 [Quillaja saponaria]|uniref:RING-H2 finger protein ATL48 n=1 Tax=Quillaja saponaria TaxID=32244 RepID=A0AAD7P8Q7_QUISA|nr:RING-H2 finger protein ATL48 [Quillaja saponaria]